jgi:hypothetical protein
LSADRASPGQVTADDVDRLAEKYKPAWETEDGAGVAGAAPTPSAAPNPASTAPAPPVRPATFKQTLIGVATVPASTPPPAPGRPEPQALPAPGPAAPAPPAPPQTAAAPAQRSSKFAGTMLGIAPPSNPPPAVKAAEAPQKAPPAPKSGAAEAPTPPQPPAVPSATLTTTSTSDGASPNQFAVAVPPTALNRPLEPTPQLPAVVIADDVQADGTPPAATSEPPLIDAHWATADTALDLPARSRGPRPAKSSQIRKAAAFLIGLTAAGLSCWLVLRRAATPAPSAGPSLTPSSAVTAVPPSAAPEAPATAAAPAAPTAPTPPAAEAPTEERPTPPLPSPKAAPREARPAAVTPARPAAPHKASTPPKPGGIVRDVPF